MRTEDLDCLAYFLKYEAAARYDEKDRLQLNEAFVRAIRRMRKAKNSDESIGDEADDERQCA